MHIDSYAQGSIWFPYISIVYVMKLNACGRYQMAALLLSMAVGVCIDHGGLDECIHMHDIVVYPHIYIIVLLSQYIAITYIIF